MKKRIVSLLLASALLSALMAAAGSTGTDASAVLPLLPAASEQAQTSAPAPTAAPQTDSAEKAPKKPPSPSPPRSLPPMNGPCL